MVLIILAWLNSKLIVNNSIKCYIKRVFTTSYKFYIDINSLVALWLTSRVRREEMKDLILIFAIQRKQKNKKLLLWQVLGESRTIFWGPDKLVLIFSPKNKS